MKKWIGLLGCLIFLISGCQQKTNDQIIPLSLEEAGELLTLYYQKPNAKQLPGMLAALGKPGVFNKNMVAPVTGFLAALSWGRPADWQVIKDLTFEDETLNKIIAAVPTQVEQLEKILADSKQVAGTPASLDFLWGAFAATGDIRFVEVIVRSADSPDVHPLVQAAAKWSLNSQRKQCPEVDELLKKKESSASK